MRSPASPFRFPVSDLVHDPGSHRRVGLDAPVSYEIELARTAPDARVTGDVDLRSATGGITVSGAVETTIAMTCNRCLTTWEEALRVRFFELVSPAGGGTDYTLDGDDLDLEPIVRDEVTLALPVAPVCRPECLGLCPTCGADLNTGACSGHPEDSSSPFAGLRDLLETHE